MKFRLSYKWAIAIIAVILAVSVGVMLYCIPKTTKQTYTLQTTKVDADCNELGTYTLSVTIRQQDYLFRDSRMSITIEPFDTLYSFLWDETDGEGCQVYEMSALDYQYISLMAYCTAAYSYDFCSLAFAEDMDWWMFCNESEQVYYVGSVSGTASTEEMIQRFALLGPIKTYEP